MPARTQQDPLIVRLKNRNEIKKNQMKHIPARTQLGSIDRASENAAIARSTR
jgi:hypothetical protein